MMPFPELASHFGAETTSTPISDAIAPPVPADLRRPIGLSDPEQPSWVEPVKQQLQEIVHLQEGWDGFGARPIRADVLVFAIELLRNVMRADTPAPHITPMSHEGVQLEWHENGKDLEIEIETPGEAWVSFEDQTDGIDNSWQITSDFRSLSDPITKLANQNSLTP